MKRNNGRNIGRFYVGPWLDLDSLFTRMGLVFRQITYINDSDKFEVFGESDLFRELKPGEDIPTYVIHDADEILLAEEKK